MFALNTRKEDKHLVALGAAIRFYREKVGFSQEEFAEKIKAPVKFVQRLEGGLEEPRTFALIACAKALETTASELMEQARSGRESSTCLH
jgi:transcriptional regulator with XRE-family HTH domain